MQASLVVFLVALVIFAVVSYRVGFRKPWSPLQYRSKAAFVVLVFLLIPVVVFVLWEQAGAKKELAEIGIVPHPSLTESSGIATGGPLGSERIWVFRSDQNPAAILDFYRDSKMRRGWELSSESPMVLILRQGSQRLTIAANETRTETVVMYSLGPGAEPGRRSRER